MVGDNRGCDVYGYELLLWNDDDDSFYLEHNYLLTLKQYIWAP